MTTAWATCSYGGCCSGRCQFLCRRHEARSCTTKLVLLHAHAGLGHWQDGTCLCRLPTRVRKVLTLDFHTLAYVLVLDRVNSALATGTHPGLRCCFWADPALRWRSRSERLSTGSSRSQITASRKCFFLSQPTFTAFST